MNNIFLLVFLLSQLSLVIFCALREIKRQMNDGEIALFSSNGLFLLVFLLFLQILWPFLVLLAS